VKEYAWKNYHNSYDHNNDKTYLFNWTRMWFLSLTPYLNTS
jgi:hypothetical protein